ncbi:MAG: ABC transporter permease [Phycisphaeraceae bacterium]
MLRTVAGFGAAVEYNLGQFGAFTRFSLSAGWWTGHWLSGRSRVGLLLPQFYSIGTRSIPVVGLVGLFVGAVLGIEAFDQFEAIGQESRLGGIIGLSVLRQIGPVLAAVMIAGRVGGAISAELGSMKVTEQIDAIRVMGADPVDYLVVPRVVACVVMVPVLTVFSNLMGVFGGHVVCVWGFGVDSRLYWDFSQRFIGNWDIFTGLGKALIFGLTIGLISCYKGFHCGSGAQGVGRAATDSFVTAFIAIIVLNFFLAKFFKDMYYILFGYGGPTAFTG